MSDVPLVLKVHRLRPDARLPVKAHGTDAAFDVAAVEPLTVGGPLGGRTHRIPTGIAVELPPGYYAQLLTRSSHAARGIAVLGGVIDPSYRGEWIVNFWVPSAFGEYVIQPGDRIAQFTLHRVIAAVIEEANGLSDSERGIKAFGSSGR